MSEKMLERIFPVLGCEPVDLDTAAITGDYVSLKNYGRVLIILGYGDGTAGKDPQPSIYQATDVTGTDAKVLNALETGRIYRMDAATYAAYAALTSSTFVWTKVTQSTADEAYAVADNGEAVGMICLEIRRDDLDTTNNFDCIRCDVSDPGAAKVGFLLYILGDPDYPSAPELMKAPIVD